MNWLSIRAREMLATVFASLLVCCSAPAAAADGYVICHPGVKLAAGDVRDVFIGEKHFADAVKLTPVDNSALQAEFLSRVIRLEAGKYSTVWTKKSFRDGVNPPPLKASDAEVVEFVRRTPGAIGYVSNPVNGVVVVGKI